MRLNEQTGYTISELKRDNIDRQNALDSVLTNYLNKKNNYSNKTSDETKEKDKKNKDKKISRINSDIVYPVCSFNRNKFNLFGISAFVSKLFNSIFELSISFNLYW